MGKYSKSMGINNDEIKRNPLIVEGCTNDENIEKKIPNRPRKWMKSNEMMMMMMMVQLLIPTCKSPTTICIGWLCKTIVLIVVNASADADTDADDDDDGCAVASYLLVFAEEESILFLFYSFRFLLSYLYMSSGILKFLMLLHQFDIYLMFAILSKQKKTEFNQMDLKWIYILFSSLSLTLHFYILWWAEITVGGNPLFQNNVWNVSKLLNCYWLFIVNNNNKNIT